MAESAGVLSLGEVIYQHPLAYLLGLEGLALLRGWAGDFDQEFVEARLAEVRRLLDEKALTEHPGVRVGRGDSRTGYAQWAASYDEPRNGLFDLDEPIVRPLFDAVAPGVALDAACGTGRFAELLACRHQVIGIDGSPEMLERARVRVPAGDFRLGTLDQLPVPDGSVDLVTSALALSHVPDLGPVLREFARALRPGGHVIISDVHPQLIFLGSVVKSLGPDGEPGLVPTYRHSAGDLLRAALPHGFRLRHCEEAPGPSTQADQPAPHDPLRDDLRPGPWADWPWSLMSLVPAAAGAAGDGPAIVVWHFTLEPGS